VFLREAFAAGVTKEDFSIEQSGGIFPDGATARAHEAAVMDDFEQRAAELGYRLLNVGRPTKAGGDTNDPTTIAKRTRAPHRGPIHDSVTGEEFEGIAACSRALGVSMSLVSEVVSGKRKSVGGRRLAKGPGFSVAAAA
jgi:hypothetical protein